MLILFSGALPVGAGSPRDSGYGAVELSRPLDPGGGRLTGEVRGAPSGPRAAGDEYWDSLFTLNRLDGSARAIAVSGSQVYVGGEFTQAGGQPANHIARWDPSANGGQGAWFPLGSGVSDTVYAIAISGTQVYVGGIFTQAGGQPASNIACWDPSFNGGQGAWFPLGTGVYGGVEAIAVSGTQVYVGGTFTQAGGAAGQPHCPLGPFGKRRAGGLAPPGQWG